LFSSYSVYRDVGRSSEGFGFIGSTVGLLPPPTGGDSATAIATEGTRFYLDDDTGTAAVDVLGNAEINLAKTGQCKFGQESVGVGVGVFGVQFGKRIPVGTREGPDNADLENMHSG
jgi:hypothetical protein